MSKIRITGRIRGKDRIQTMDRNPDKEQNQMHQRPEICRKQAGLFTAIYFDFDSRILELQNAVAIRYKTRVSFENSKQRRRRKWEKFI